MRRANFGLDFDQRRLVYEPRMAVERLLDTRNGLILNDGGWGRVHNDIDTSGQWLKNGFRATWCNHATLPLNFELVWNYYSTHTTEDDWLDLSHSSNIYAAIKWLQAQFCITVSFRPILTTVMGQFMSTHGSGPSQCQQWLFMANDILAVACCRKMVFLYCPLSLVHTKHDWITITGKWSKMT